MNPTPGAWTYNPDFREVQWLDRIIAKVVEGQEGAPQEELHANGYLMAASVELRDELTNLSWAVASYLDVDINDDDEKERTHNQLDAMLQRAEHALGHIFPPEDKS